MTDPDNWLKELLGHTAIETTSAETLRRILGIPMPETTIGELVHSEPNAPLRGPKTSHAWIDEIHEIPTDDGCPVPPPVERAPLTGSSWPKPEPLREIPVELRAASGNAMWMLQADLAGNGEIYESHGTDDLLDYVRRTIGSGVPTGAMPYSSPVGMLVAAAGALLTVADRVIRGDA